ncbi:MAG: hypothetical protein HY518_02335, partial [Candidatus Aenigmarchaeota archaeon]|nr:hypothetical protein [Candidatus Aenigmarchaeota archaeon]
REGYNNIGQKIDRTIFEANEKNADIGNKKAKYIKLILITFFIGFMFIILSNIISNIGLEVVQHG